MTSQDHAERVKAAHQRVLATRAEAEAAIEARAVALRDAQAAGISWRELGGLLVTESSPDGVSAPRALAAARPAPERQKIRAKKPAVD